MSAPGHALPVAFFARSPEKVARDLLGCLIVVESDDERTSGHIVETEAYLGADDPGSHASTRGITPRNTVMYGPPGVTYVYFTYGNHHMLNIVCEERGTAGAVLIRALEPFEGIDAMTMRRRGRAFRDLCNGPGKLTQALGVDLSDNAITLGSGRISVYDGGRPPIGAVGTSGRIGLSAGHQLQLRYFVEGNPFVSRGRVGPPPEPRTEHPGRAKA